MSTVNDNIRNFRIFRGFSQRELGNQLNKSPNVISNWETGTHSPDLDTIQSICRILNVTPNELFGWEENKEYSLHLKRLEKYNSQIEDLYQQREELNRQIIELRNKRDEEIPEVKESDDEPRYRGDTHRRERPVAAAQMAPRRKREYPAAEIAPREPQPRLIRRKKED